MNSKRSKLGHVCHLTDVVNVILNQLYSLMEVTEVRER